MSAKPAARVVLAPIGDTASQPISPPQQVVRRATPARAAETARAEAPSESPAAETARAEAPSVSPASSSAVGATKAPFHTRSPAVAPPTPAATSPQPTSLQAELELLESARRSLNAGRWDNALAGVDDYEKLHAAGTLAAEARVLRIEALLGAGRTEEARSAARAFLRAQLKGMQSRRVASLLAKIERAP
jgi:hypothetical protein